MDYGRLIGDAWNMTWRHRFLWILALFAPSGVGGCGANFNLPSSFSPSSSINPTTSPSSPSPYAPGVAGSPEFQQIGTAISAWIAAHLGLIIGLAALALVLFLVFVVLYFIAQGGLASATIRLARGQPDTLGRAWGDGLHYFWRYLGLWVLEIVIVFVAVALIVILVLGGYELVRQIAGGTALALGIVLGLLGLALFLAAFVGLILFSIAITYAQRIVVDHNVGPMAAIQRGVGLTRARLGTSTILWLINFGLGIGIGIATIVLDVIVLIPLGIVGAIMFIAFRFTAITIGYAVLAAIVFFAAAWLVAAIGNTFIWNYWTLGYLRLEETRERTPVQR